MNKLKLFYDRIIDTSLDEPSVICMTPSNNFCGKRYHIKSYEDLENAVKQEKVDLYFTYNHQNSNYKRGNNLTKGFSFLAFDVESSSKIGNGCVKMENLQNQYIIINEFLKKCDLNNYTLICSGNGFHLYLHLDKYYEIKDRDKARYIYKECIKFIAKLLFDFTNGKIKADDRTDTGGILRVPYTINSKTLKLQKPRQVNIIDDKIDKFNENNKPLKYMIEKLSKIYDDNINIKSKYPQIIPNANYQSTFFNNLLSNPNEWEKYCNVLDECFGRHNTFIKQLGNYVATNPNQKQNAIDFLKVLESKENVNRLSQLLQWEESAKLNNYFVCEKEIFNWLKSQKVNTSILLSLFGDNKNE